RAVRRSNRRHAAGAPRHQSRRRPRRGTVRHQPSAQNGRGKVGSRMTATTEQPAAPSREHGGPDILCEDLVRIYSTEGVEVQALQGLNLRIDPGDVVALVGASGSGKSTLLNILSGLDTPTGGRAQVAGTNLLSMTRKQRVHYQREIVGFVWQQTSRNLMPFLTAAENIALPLVITGSRQRARRVAELFDLLDIGDVADRRPPEMSGGQQQRV